MKRQNLGSVRVLNPKKEVSISRPIKCVNECHLILNETKCSFGVQ